MLELVMEARRTGIQSEAAAASHHFASAMRESETRFES